MCWWICDSDLMYAFFSQWSHTSQMPFRNGLCSKPKCQWTMMGSSHKSVSQRCNSFACVDCIHGDAWLPSCYLDPEQIFACVSQLGGTVGDIESMPFIEAFRQFQFKVKRENFCNIHVSLVPQVGDNPRTAVSSVNLHTWQHLHPQCFSHCCLNETAAAFIEIIIITIIVSVLSLVLQESRRLNRHKTACESSVVWACHLIWLGRFPLFICFKQIQNLHMGYSMKTAVKLLHEREIPENRNFEEHAYSYAKNYNQT